MNKIYILLKDLCQVFAKASASLLTAKLSIVREQVMALQSLILYLPSKTTIDAPSVARTRIGNSF